MLEIGYFNNKILIFFHQLYTRFQHRILIPHPQIRKLLSIYVSKGLSSMEFLDLMSLLEQHFPCYCSIVNASAVHYDLIKDIHTCDKCWSELICSISSASAAHGILHPSSRSSQLISIMQSKDISNDPENMKCLQEEVPVLFELIQSLGYYPKDVLSPFLNELLNKANNPFSYHDMKGRSTMIQKSADVIDNNDLAYFSKLPKVRNRRHYKIDKSTSGPACKKRRSAHPSLLPGVFTLFCQHGNSNNCTLRDAYADCTTSLYVVHRYLLWVSSDAVC